MGDECSNMATPGFRACTVLLGHIVWHQICDVTHSTVTHKLICDNDTLEKLSYTVTEAGHLLQCMPKAYHCCLEAGLNLILP